jgi:hypothetical protein
MPIGLLHVSQGKKEVPGFDAFRFFEPGNRQPELIQHLILKLADALARNA